MKRAALLLLSFFGPSLLHGATDLVFPWVTHNAQFRAKIVVNNLNAAPVTVLLRAVRADAADPAGAEQSVSWTLEPLEQRVSAAGDVFSDLAEGAGFSVFLSSSADNIDGAFVVSGTKADGLGDSPAQGNVVPVSEAGSLVLFNFLPTERDSEAASAAVLVNVGSRPAEVQFYAYQNGQRILSEQPVTVPAGRPFAVLTETLFPELSGDLYLVAATDQPLVGLAFLFNEAREPSMANARVIASLPDPDAPAGDPLTAGVSQFFIDQEIAGTMVSRRVTLVAPPVLEANPSYPVVFAFHGAGGSGDAFANNQHLNGLINSGAFVGVYPDGHADNGGNGGFWNLGTEPTSADDVAFVDAIVAKLGTIQGLDGSRRYALGISNGAGMVNLLGKSTAHFRAIAPLYSQQTVATGALEAPALVSVFQLNGDNDTLIPLNGGPSPVGEFMSAADSAQNWADAAACDSPPEEAVQTWGNATLDAFTYGGCRENHEVVYFVARNIGHSGFQNGEANSRMFAEIWAFFQSH
ncbi:alpha/beta hydrolase family esterase [Acanthopleuribacter pedis]|uniref:Poly(3-hydroxybutyrate) depolymerase n=1 Tax=Acanthopleuribacter pedis TaxID=442870 RepID=A0A8J7QGT9_9BACT|nr:PHB depolymerase family esterase [Acanthopleuribacter pedis]MBO1322080.1 hypothetical protein [Acanthopleuribacter pedis]